MLWLLIVDFGYGLDFKAVWLVLLIDCFLVDNLLVSDQHQIRQQRVV